MKYCFSHITGILGAQAHIVSDLAIKQLSIDSRTVLPSSSTLFFALVGPNHNAHRFLQELYSQKGIRNFVVKHDSVSVNEFPEANFAFVPDTLVALQELTAYHRRQFHIPVVGITGSNGKTVVKEWLFQLVGASTKTVRSPKSYNSQVGVPLSVWLMGERHELAFFEAGISQKNEMERLARIISPTVGIFTHLGSAHEDHFASQEEKLREKLTLFTSCNKIIYRNDDELVNKEIRQFARKHKLELFSWSAHQKADLMVTGIEKNGQFTTLKYKFRDGQKQVAIPFLDDASIENALHCLAFLLCESVPFKPLAFQELNPVAMRMELKTGVNNCTIINDSYNSDFGSLSMALDFLNQQRHHKKKTVILSDIFQSDSDDAELYASMSGLLEQMNIWRLIGIGANIMAYRDAFAQLPQFACYPTTDAFVQAYTSDSFRDEAILLKGSRRFQFERISQLLQQKTHRTLLEIDLNAMAHNLGVFRSALNYRTKTLVMVKAFAYGSGLYEIANLLEYHKIDYLGVAFADEGIALRKAGFTLPILVLSADEHSLASCLKYRLEPTIYSLGIFESLSELLEARGIEAFPVHIELDTGMHRLGFMPADVPALARALANYPRVRIVSVFSHLAGSDEDRHDEFTRYQIDRFTEATDHLRKLSQMPFMRHILNSAGIERFPQAQFDMVRLGIGIYGVSATDHCHLKHVGAFKTFVSQVKQLSANETIGYSRRGYVGQQSTIAIIPVGYADGLNRRLSNGVGKLLVNGQEASIVGNICMDMCMLDVTGLQVAEGDEVILFGKDHPVQLMADALGTIPYEVFTSISDRVKRVYFWE